MKFFLPCSVLIVFCVGLGFRQWFLIPNAKHQIYNTETAASDWFINQRIFPYSSPDYPAYKRAVLQMRQEQQTTSSNNRHGYSPPQVTTAAWQYAGPENLGGRVVDVEMPANSLTTIYVCAASGGVFKSTNSGNSWVAIFDSNPSLSIGDLAIAPSDTNVLYCGTGEANAGGGSVTYDGAGIFKSSNGGVSWSYVGLDMTRNTGRIAIDPKSPNRVYAATMGDLFGNNPDRGLYRTTDGGATWQNVLYANDSTGAIDVVINPLRPDTIFACLWTRVRRVDRRNYGGPASGIYRSYNGGNTWTKLTNGIPSGNLGRIGIDISKSNPNILYALITDDSGGNAVILKSVNNGDSWSDVTNNFSGATYSYWFGRIKIDPNNANVVYAMDYDLWKTTNGGSGWSILSSSIHVDQHELFINATNTNLLLLGNDGGFYISTNGGNSWTLNEKLPIMQFYTCEVDEQNINALYGGAQDNGVNTTSTGGINDWFQILYGDGFVVLVDPKNSNNVYCEYQYANTNFSTNGINTNDRTNWNTPFVFNPRNSNTLYLGTDRLYKLTNWFAGWTALSPDLTNGSGTASYPTVYGTITTIAVAASDTNVIYVGTDDGNVQVTTNEGASWNLVSSSLPYRWVTHIEIDPRNAMSAYVTLSGYRYHDNMSHVYHTVNGGNSWSDIGGNLPDIPVNDLIIDTSYKALYVATDIGVYYSYLGSNDWKLLGTGLPLVPVTDLRLHYPTHTLIAATYGRSMYKFDVSIITEVAAEEQPAAFSIQLLQNPVKDYLPLNIYSEKQTNSSFIIYDMNGKRILVQEVQLLSGNNAFNIPLHLINNGIYLACLSYTGKIYSVKVCVSK